MSKNTTFLRDGTEHNRIINGCWQFSEGHSSNTEQPLDSLLKHVEKGFSVFDGADIYSGVEELFGEVIKKCGISNQLRFHTKHVPDLQDVVEGNITTKKTIEQVMRSCSRMNIQKLSNVQFHWWDYTCNGYDISLNTLFDLQREGIIEHIGVTNTNVVFLKKLESELNFIPMTTQNQYSILDRRPEKHLVPHILAREIGLYCYGSLMGGLLSNRYLGKEKPKEPLENRSLRKYLCIIDDWGTWKLFQELLEVLNQVAKLYDASIAEVASSWVLHQKGVSSIILGTRSTQHISSLDRILNLQLTPDDLQKIDIIYLKGKAIVGDVFDLERDEPRHRDIMKFNLNKES